MVRALTLWLVVLLATLASRQDAHAQGFGGSYGRSVVAAPSGLGGFLDGIFAKPQPANPPLILPQPMVQRSRPKTPANINDQLAPQSSIPAATLKSGDSQEQRGRSAQSTLGGGLRTMCVRLCDGYYWPITWNANRSRLAHDGKVCASSCQAETRLFTMPDSGEAKDMVDGNGRNYTKLPTAFRFRKAQAAECRCKPDAWEQSALDRHISLGASVAPVDTATGVTTPTRLAAVTQTPIGPSPAELEAQALAGGGVTPVMREQAVAEFRQPVPAQRVAAIEPTVPPAPAAEPAVAPAKATKPGRASKMVAGLQLAAPAKPKLDVPLRRPVVAGRPVPGQGAPVVRAALPSPFVYAQPPVATFRTY